MINKYLSFHSSFSNTIAIPSIVLETIEQENWFKEHYKANFTEFDNQIKGFIESLQPNI